MDSGAVCVQATTNRAVNAESQIDRSRIFTYQRTSDRIQIISLSIIAKERRPVELSPINSGNSWSDLQRWLVARK